MKPVRRGQRGFTLVELLIVLAILAVLAAVVIPNVTGMLGRGQKQSYETDAKTIQSGVMAYIMDIRASAHYIPMGAAYPGTKQTEKTSLYQFVLDTTGTDTTFPDALPISAVNQWVAGAWAPVATATGVQSAAIQMEWLVEKQQTGGVDDAGPYLDKSPKSAGTDNFVNPPSATGSYTWVVDYSGKVFAIYLDDKGTPVTTDDVYYAGYCDTYP